MKKLFAALVFSALVAGAATAKGFSLNSVGGRLNFPDLGIFELSAKNGGGADSGFLFAFGLDGFVEFNIINDRFFLRPELNINYGMSKNFGFDVKRWDIDIPAYFGFKFNEHFDLFAGLILGAQINDNDWDSKSKAGFHWGIQPIGADFNIPVGSKGAITINIKPLTFSWAYYKNFNSYEFQFLNAGVGYRYYFNK